MNSIKYNLISTITLLILDFLWIWLFMGKSYAKMIPRIQGTPMKVKKISAILAYGLMVLGLNMFVINNISNEKTKKWEGLLRAFLFGIIVYGIYDFTAGSVLEKWDFKLAMIDILWGGFVYMISYLTSSLLIHI